MDVYMFLGFLGTGGRAAAVRTRANMFAHAGYQASILVLDYQPALKNRVEQLRSNGALDRAVNVINVFDVLADAADGSNRRTIFPRLGMGLRSFAAPKLPRDFQPSESVEIERDPAGNIVRAKRYDKGQLVEDQYFSKKGRLYLRRVFGGKAVSGVLVYDHEIGAFRHYSSYHGWQVSWLSNFAKTRPEKPVIICDSPNKMAGVFAEIDPQVATRVGGVHLNHFDVSSNASGREVKPIYRSFLERISDLDALVVLTDAQRRDIGREFGNLDKIHVIPNVLTDSPLPAAVREKSRLALFARLVSGKRVDDAIRALVRIKEKVPSVVLDIYGQGERKYELQKLIDELGLNESVSLCGYTQDPHSEMASSIATLFPTDTEAFGNAVAESMLAGTPVISYDVKYGPADLIEHGVDGILVAHADVDAMAAAAIELLQNPSLASEMGRRGRAKIRKRYTEGPVMERWEVVLETVGVRN